MMKSTLLIFTSILALISFAGETSREAESTDVKVKLEGGGMDGIFPVGTIETSCGALNWDGIPKNGEMSGGQYEITVQLLNGCVILKEHTLASHEGISSDTSVKMIIPLRKLPWKGKISQTTATVFRERLKSNK